MHTDDPNNVFEDKAKPPDVAANAGLTMAVCGGLQMVGSGALGDLHLSAMYLVNAKRVAIAGGDFFGAISEGTNEMDSK